MNKKNRAIYIFILVFVFLGLSCSSAPKRPAQVNVVRKQAEQELDMANKAAGQGQYNNALLLITEARRKAVSADDSSLMIRANLLHGNILLSMDRINEAFPRWDAAITEAQSAGNTELLSVSRIFYARGSLLAKRESPANVLEIVAREQVNIKDRYYTAYSWQARGLALRAMESYNEAENAVRRALEIHEKDRYLEDASYDWYIIASIRSLAGNYNGALQALEASMSIDRRIENSWGLSSSWKAMGDVYGKMGRENEARNAYARSEAILKAMN